MLLYSKSQVKLLLLSYDFFSILDDLKLYFWTSISFPAMYRKFSSGVIMQLNTLSISLELLLFTYSKF